MNSWLIFGATLIVQAFAAAFIYGRFSQQVEDNKQRTMENSNTIESHRIENAKIFEVHRSRLDTHDVELGKMASWRDGYNAGSKSVTI